MRLTEEDLRDLSALDGGQFLKFIIHLINLMKIVNRLTGKEKEHETLKPVRDKILIEEYGREERVDFRFTMTVQRAAHTAATTDIEDRQTLPELSENVL